MRENSASGSEDDQFPTTAPEATLAIAIEFLREESRGELRAVGISSFGPIDILHRTSLYLRLCHLHCRSPVGRTTIWQAQCATPWACRLVLTPTWTRPRLARPLGAAQNLTDFLYLTVGTGIGGGTIINGRVLHGLVQCKGRITGSGMIWYVILYLAAALIMAIA